MIKINLLPQRKAKRAQAEPGSKELVQIGRAHV